MLIAGPARATVLAMNTHTYRMTTRPFAALLGAALAASLLASPVLAAPLRVAVQGSLQSSGGGPVADGKYGAAFALWDAPQGGQLLFEEKLLGVDVSGGAFAVVLGAGNDTLDDTVFVGPDGAAQAVYFGVAVQGEPELPRVRIEAVPLAAHAARAAVAYGLTCSGCVSSGQLSAAAVQASHVDFTYAASTTKGGPATSALVAGQADEAAVAVVAQGLGCTGCVGLDQLAPDVAQGFLPKTGGVVSGPLEVSATVHATQDVQLGPSDLAASPCSPAMEGSMRWDAAAKRLAVCDGSAWQQLVACNEVCTPADQVPCGAPLTNACGTPGGCSGTGTACDAGQICAPSGCLAIGSSASAPATSCKALLALAPNTPDGTYWLDPDGDAGVSPFEAFCDMTTDGGGWTRIDYAADLPYANHFEGADAWQWLPADFTFVLADAQIEALQAISTEGKQSYVGQCNGVLHYYRPEDGTYQFAFGFRLFDGTETPSGQQSYAPFFVTVNPDGCAANGGEAGALDKATVFHIEDARVPIRNVRSRDNGGSDELFGSPLTNNPAWLR